MSTTPIARCLLAVSLLSLPASVLAQGNGSTPPPKVLKIVRESVKPGKSAAHAANESAWIQALKHVHYDIPTLALKSITGDPQVLFLVGFPSWAEFQTYVEKWDSDPELGRIASLYDPKEAGFVSSTQTMTCRFHREYSYQPDVNLGEYRYVAVSVTRFRPGTDIGGYFKTIENARAQAKVDNHTIVYEINSGAPSGSYLTITPMSSIARWDQPQNPAVLAALRAAGWRQMVGADVMEAEFRLYEFAPRMSLPSKEVTAANPQFWNAGAAERPARRNAPKQR